MTNGTKLSLFSGAALLALSMATPASAAPGGSYMQTCRDIQQSYDSTLTATCQTRDGSWLQSRLETSDCSGDIANIDGRLTCNNDNNNNNTFQVDRNNDRMHDEYNNHDGAYRDGERRNDRQADRYDRNSNGDAYATSPSYGESYGYRPDDNRGYSGGNLMPRGQLVRRMERQGYSHVRDLRPIRNDRDWRATAFWHGRSVVVRLNPRTGRVLAARYI